MTDKQRWEILKRFDLPFCILDRHHWQFLDTIHHFNIAELLRLEYAIREIRRQEESEIELKSVVTVAEIRT